MDISGLRQHGLNLVAHRCQFPTGCEIESGASYLLLRGCPAEASRHPETVISIN